MPSELLSIGIPTRNRARYLEDLLLGLEAQIRGAGLSPEVVKVYVSDNCSTDRTPEIVGQLAAKSPHFVYSRQRQNVGAGRNVMTCARLARGQYCWVCGDDELLIEGGLSSLLGALEADRDLALVVNLDTNYACPLQRPARFPSYREFALACAREKPHILAEHTLISSNVFRTDLFDQAVAEARLATDFCHMYAVLNSLIERGGAVLLPAFGLITVRARRAPCVDGEWPANLEQSWLDYLRWQKEKMGLEELRPEAAIEHVRRVLFHKLSRHPLRYVRDNLPAVVQPQAWAFILKRLWLHLRWRRRGS